MSATPDSTLANPEQRIADLERQLAEREAELAEARERETATAEVLQVINSSPGDFAPVFDAILEKAHRLCGAAMGSLGIFDGDTWRAVVQRGYREPLASVLRQPSRWPDNPLQQELIDGAPLVHVADLAQLYLPIARANVAAGVRALLVVALRKDDALLGTITIARHEPRPFSDKEIALLQSFAAQAVIAIENARLINETREALEQQTATAEVLQVINSSPGDLTPVFDAILEKAHSLCGAEFGGLGVFDGEQFRVLARNGVQDFSEIRYLVRPGGNTPIERLAQGEPLIHIADVRLTDAYGEHSGFRANMDSQAVRTLLGVPLRKDGALLGAITAFRREVRPFSDKQIALLQNFAAQAVIAMENARLLTETREALEQQTATAEVLQVINSSPGDLAPVFDALLEKALSLCGAAFGGLFIRDGNRARAMATRGLPDRLNDFVREGFAAASEGRLISGEAIEHIADLSQSPLVKYPGLAAAAELGGAHTMLNVALRKDGVLLGFFSIFRREVRPFSERQIELVRNFAAQAVIAMENARLLIETHEALDQQTATAEVLQVINSSPGDLSPVFEAILEKAHSLCGADRGALVSFDGQLFRAIATRGMPEAFAEFLRRGFPFVPGGPMDELLRGEPVHTLDLAAFVAESPPAIAHLAQEALELAGTRTILMVPLCKDGALLGYIAAYRLEVRSFTNKQIALLENFAAQAVIAMENARLLGELRQRTDEVAELNRGLEARIAEQVDELGRVGRLKRFLAPQLAELIVSQGDEKILESHRREIVVVFCDLRGYTAFTETAEPEEVLDFLREYHGALGPLVSQFEGTLDQFSGDGIMVFFNDPVPCPDPAERAVKMSMAMREAAGKLITAWRPRGCELGFGVGIAWGYATLGQIGFTDRSGYTAIGTVCNLAARLCDEAKDGQILITGRVAAALGAAASLEVLGNLELKGLSRPVAAFNVVQSTSPAEARPNLTVVTRGPGA